jgi:hypothetical protein
MLLQLAVPGAPETNLTNTDGTSVKLNVTNNLRIIPGDIGNVRIGVSYLFDTPLYWKLPSNFLGDKVNSFKLNYVQSVKVFSVLGVVVQWLFEIHGHFLRRAHSAASKRSELLPLGANPGKQSNCPGVLLAATECHWPVSSAFA